MRVFMGILKTYFRKILWSSTNNEKIPPKSEFNICVFLSHQPNIFHPYCQNRSEKFFMTNIKLAIKNFSPLKKELTAAALFYFDKRIPYVYSGSTKKQQRWGVSHSVVIKF